MAIPKEKLALLIAGIKPKMGMGADDEAHETADSDKEEETESVSSPADNLWKALVAFEHKDREAFDDHIAEFQDCLNGADKGEYADKEEE